MSLHRLIYHSRQSPEVVKDLDVEVRKIIQVSIANNRAADLTGLLATVQGSFVQVLEGSSKAVQTAYGRILNDPRHADAVVISAGPAERRLFSDWNMCARAIAPSDKAILDVIDTKGAFDPRQLRPESALRLLTTVANIQRRTALSALAS